MVLKKSVIIALSTIVTKLRTSSSKVIKKLDDFPKPVNGIITLEKNKSYIIDNEINLLTNQIAQLDDSFNTFISTDPFAYPSGGGGALRYEGTGAMFITSGKRSSFWFKTLALFSPNGKIFDLGNTWQSLPSLSTVGTSVSCINHGLSQEDRVKLPTGIGGIDEYFKVVSVTDVDNFVIQKAPTNDITNNTECEYAAFNDNGGSVLADLSLVQADEIGNIQNYNFFTTSFAAAECGNGYKLVNVGRTNYSFLQWTEGKNNVGAIALSLYGIFNNFTINSGNYIQPKSNESIMYVDPQSTLEAGVVTGVSFDASLNGKWFATNSLDQTDPYWKYASNSGLPDSSVEALLYVANNSDVTTINQINTPVLIVDTWQSGNLERFKLENNRLVYTGVEKTTVDIILVATSDAESASNIVVSLYIAKNGTVIQESKGKGSVKTESQVTCLANQIVETGDYFEAYIENNTNTQNVTVTDMTLQVH